MSPDEGILGDFLGILPITQQGEDLSENPPLIAEHELVIGRKIPSPGAVESGLVGFGLHFGRNR